MRSKGDQAPDFINWEIFRKTPEYLIYIKRAVMRKFALESLFDRRYNYDSEGQHGEAIMALANPQEIKDYIIKTWPFLNPENVEALFQEFEAGYSGRVRLEDQAVSEVLRDVGEENPKKDRLN